MRLSIVLSPIAIAVVGLLCVAPDAPASGSQVQSAASSTSSVRVHGSYLPVRMEWDDVHWGYGITARTSVNPRWGIDFGVSRFVGSKRSVTPVTIGFVHGSPAGGARPWVEVGAGYYRFDASDRTAWVMPAPGYADYVRVRPMPMHGYKIGGYFGAGCDIPLSGRVGLGSGIRVHGWSEPDGLIALQSGLTYDF